MKVQFLIGSKEYSEYRCTKVIELETPPTEGQVFTFPVGEEGTQLCLTVKFGCKIPNEGKFPNDGRYDYMVVVEYEVDRLSLPHLIADGWKEGVFIWPV